MCSGSCTHFYTPRKVQERVLEHEIMKLNEVEKLRALLREEKHKSDIWVAGLEEANREKLERAENE